jgi:hypothetical protein
LTSLKVSSGCCVDLYEKVDYAGKKGTFCSNSNFVGSMNDKTASLKSYSQACGPDNNPTNVCGTMEGASCERDGLSYKCVCPPGYFDDGTTCTAV